MNCLNSLLIIRIIAIIVVINGRKLQDRIVPNIQCPPNKNILQEKLKEFYTVSTVLFSPEFNLNQFQSEIEKTKRLARQLLHNLTSGSKEKKEENSLSSLPKLKRVDKPENYSGTYFPIIYETKSILELHDVINLCKSASLMDLPLSPPYADHELLQFLLEQSCHSNNFDRHLEYYNDCGLSETLANYKGMASVEECLQRYYNSDYQEILKLRNCGYYLKLTMDNFWIKDTLGKEVHQLTFPKDRNKYLSLPRLREYVSNFQLFPKFVRYKDYPKDLHARIQCLTGIFSDLKSPANETEPFVPDMLESSLAADADGAKVSDSDNDNIIVDLSELEIEDDKIILDNLTSPTRSERAAIISDDDWFDQNLKELFDDAWICSDKSVPKTLYCIGPGTSDSSDNRKQFISIPDETIKRLKSLENWCQYIISEITASATVNDSEALELRVTEDWTRTMVLLEHQVAETSPTLAHYEEINKAIDGLNESMLKGSIHGQVTDIPKLIQYIKKDHAKIGDIQYAMEVVTKATHLDTPINLGKDQWMAQIATPSNIYNLYRIHGINFRGMLPIHNYLVEKQGTAIMATYMNNPIKDALCHEFKLQGQPYTICQVDETYLIPLGDKTCAQSIFGKLAYDNDCLVEYTERPTFFLEYCNGRKETLVTPFLTTITQSCYFAEGTNDIRDVIKYKVQVAPGEYPFRSTCQLWAEHGQLVYGGGPLPQKPVRTKELGIIQTWVHWFQKYQWKLGVTCSFSGVALFFLYSQCNLDRYRQITAAGRSALSGATASVMGYFVRSHLARNATTEAGEGQPRGMGTSSQARNCPRPGQANSGPSSSDIMVSPRTENCLGDQEETSFINRDPSGSRISENLSHGDTEGYSTHNEHSIPTTPVQQRSRSRASSRISAHRNKPVAVPGPTPTVDASTSAAPGKLGGKCHPSSDPRYGELAMRAMQNKNSKRHPPAIDQQDSAKAELTLREGGIHSANHEGSPTRSSALRTAKNVQEPD